MQIGKRGAFGAALAIVAGSAAAADSSVTLYGVADTYLQYMDNGGKHTIGEYSGGSTGSLVGLKGNEALGGGLTTQFDVEAGYNLNNGSLLIDKSVLFYRQAWVGLKDERYGSLSFGRQYDVAFRIVYPVEPFNVNEVLSPFSAMVLAVDRNTLSTQYDPGRLSNSALYQTPRFNGLQGYAMYSFAATVTAPVPATTGNVLGVGVNYSGGALYAGLAYTNQRPGSETITGLPASLGLLGTEHFVGALAYRLGIVNLQFNYSYQRADTPSAHTLAAVLGTAHSLSIAEVGATIQATSADAIELAALYRNVRGAHDNTPGFEAGIDHSLSKRTSLYARVGYLKNNGTSTVSWPGNSVTEGGTNQFMAALGMTHRF